MCKLGRPVLALLSTSDRTITLPAKRWTPPVSGQLIVWLDVCTLPDTLVNTTALSTHGHGPIHNHCRVLLYIRKQYRVLTISPGKRNYCAVQFLLWGFVFLKGFSIQ